MEQNDFTSGPVRDLSSRELGTSGYTDIRLLSDSGHNRVYRAMHAGKWVVLKVARDDEGQITRNRLLLQREYDIMHAIDCIYVVKTWQMDDIPEVGRAIVMEYIQGRSLDRFLQENPSWSLRRRVADELLEALQILHAQQIVHADLKPGNILITDVGNHVRLIDFGLADTDAYVAKDLGSSPPVIDTGYVPSDNLSPEKDIYALGIILRALFPHSFRLVANRCCATPAARRYQSVRQVHAALRRQAVLMWLLPALAVTGALVALLLTVVPRPLSLEPQVVPVDTLPPKVQRDTVVVLTPVVEQPARPAVDSAWIKLQKKADAAYRSLYREYADSIANMPVKSLNQALVYHNAYAALIAKECDILVAFYPGYEHQLRQHYLSSYDRDYKRMANLYKDYPIIVVNLNGDTTFIPVKR